MEDDDDLVALSALQHWLVCPRQCALIHLEGVWTDNAATAEGNVLHRSVDQMASETRPGLRRVTAMTLRSVRLGLTGRADVVEFIPGPDGAEIAFPVEFKRGREKRDNRDKVQLCAQAMCLEEALGTTIPQGALFYAASRRRLTVFFSDHLRAVVEQSAAAVHAMLASRRTPPPVRCDACRGCSLFDWCLPGALVMPDVAAYYRRGLA